LENVYVCIQIAWKVLTASTLTRIDLCLALWMLYQVSILLTY